MKALHLHSAAYQWRRAETLHDRLCNTDEKLSEYAVEQIGMDFMEAAIVSVYSAVAAVDVFCQEVMFDKLLVSKPQDLIETLRDCSPELTGKPNPLKQSGGGDFGTFIELGTLSHMQGLTTRSTDAVRPIGFHHGLLVSCP